jgi:hypothetical protein
MVLTAAQTTAFFTAADQMGVAQATYQQMAAEGLAEVGDLADFDKTTLEQVADNLRRPAGRIPDPAGGPGTVPTPAFVFGAKSQKRLLVACDLIRYYDTVGRDYTVANLQWNQVIKNFEIQWKALKDRKDADIPDIPKITKVLTIMKWAEAFPDFLSQVIGVRTIPLSYIIRDEMTPPAAAPILLPNQPHSVMYGSVEAELIARASHAHPLYRDDNGKVYYYLEEATRTTIYAASIKPYQRARDGRGAWFALINQYAGVDKWEAEIKKQEQLLHTYKWKGQSNFSLEGFVSQHRNAFVSMEQCSQHVQYQLPNEHSRVGFLLDAIECSDAGLQAAMASVKTDSGANGMRNDFEAAVSHILPYDPVAKKRAVGKRPSALISDVHVHNDGNANVASATTNNKASIGRTGVHLRYHKSKEYLKLTKEQKDELREWRTSKEDSDTKSTKKSKSSKSFTKKQIASIVSSQVESTLIKIAKDEDKKEEEKTMESAILSMIQAEIAKKEGTHVSATLAGAPTAAKISLKSILKRAKNNN